MNYLKESLCRHIGHDIEIVEYEGGCVSLECNDCNELIFDTDIYDICTAEDNEDEES